MNPTQDHYRRESFSISESFKTLSSQGISVSSLEYDDYIKACKKVIMNDRPSESLCSLPQVKISPTKLKSVTKSAFETEKKDYLGSQPGILSEILINIKDLRKDISEMKCSLDKSRRNSIPQCDYRRPAILETLGDPLDDPIDPLGRPLCDRPGPDRPGPNTQLEQ